MLTTSGGILIRTARRRHAPDRPQHPGRPPDPGRGGRHRQQPGQAPRDRAAEADEPRPLATLEPRTPTATPTAPRRPTSSTTAWPRPRPATTSMTRTSTASRTRSEATRWASYTIRFARRSRTAATSSPCTRTSVEERGITAWQLVAAFDEAKRIRERPASQPNPSLVVSQILVDGTEVEAIWAWLSQSRRAKLVTVYDRSDGP